MRPIKTLMMLLWCPTVILILLARTVLEGVINLFRRDEGSR